MKLLKTLFLGFLFCLIPALASAQGIQFSGVAQYTNTQGQITLLPSANITVCLTTATGLPCTPTTNVYTNSGEGTIITQPIVAGADGTFSFYISSGTYQYTVTKTGFAGASYTIVVGIPSSGNSSWSGLANATANMLLTNAGFTTEFDQTSAVNWTWANTTPATVSANVASPIFNLNGNCWNGTASYLCGWTVQSSPATGSNPQQNLVFTPAGAGSSNSAQMLLNLPASFAGFPFQVNAGGTVQFRITTTVGGANSTLAAMPSGSYLSLQSSNGAVALNLNTASNTGLSTLNFALATGLNTVTFSATPTFNAALGNTQSITLTGNVTSSTLTNAAAGESLNFVICQDATGGRTFVWPTNMKGTMTIGSTLSTCSAQDFIFNGTNAYATSPGVINQ